jgi:hypothetical protein
LAVVPFASFISPARAKSEKLRRLMAHKRAAVLILGVGVIMFSMDLAEI